ncbi:MAG TPA: LuxR C-terminal-related transcriptional regulator [Bryobacteraceae bacterium]|nr:LuxR C-terminal-related transcriptional regulator [Bryobacteraceae bacterium]
MQPSYVISSRPAQEDERFRLLVDHAPFMLWSAGCDGLCTFFNKPWLEFRGRTMAQEAGNGWVEGVHPDDRQRCLDTYRRALDARQPFDIEYRLQRADGQYRWIRDTAMAQFGRDGSFMGYLGSCVEVSAPTRGTAAGPLTPREVQVLELVADGKSTKEIAVLLGISYKTADSHRSRIMEKVGVHETASLVRYAIRHGIVQA